jgi:hypothetical protein
MALKYNNHIKIVVWQKMTEKTLCDLPVVIAKKTSNLSPVCQLML